MAVGGRWREREGRKERKVERLMDGVMRCWFVCGRGTRLWVDWVGGSLVRLDVGVYIMG